MKVGQRHKLTRDIGLSEAGGAGEVRRDQETTHRSLHLIVNKLVND